ncbi:MAG: DUF1127 domain-containing protein [Pseudomonadota bacterium]
MHRARRDALARQPASGSMAVMAGWIGVRIMAWRTRRALLSLSDEQLKDIGLSRGEAHSATLRRRK